MAGKWTYKNLVQGVLYLERVQREKVEIVQVRKTPSVVRPSKKTAFAKMLEQNRRNV